MPEPFSATAPLKSVRGTVNTPGLTFTGDEDTGLYNSNPNELSVAIGGVQGAKFTSTGIELDGDINLDDGIAGFVTTLQVVTPTKNNVISLPDETGTVGLVSGISGQLIRNLNGAYSGTSTLVVDGSGNLTLSGRWINTTAGAVSAPPASLTGAWYGSGTSTTTKPQFLIEPTGTTSTAWSTAGTGLGINAPSGFTGRLLDLQLNGTSNFNVDSTGRVSVSLGTALLPSIYPGTDTNTGLWSPAADTLAASTNGSERLRITSAGNILIGTTTNTNSSALVVNGTISETVSGVQYPVVSSYDIGSAPNQIPLNGYLGQMAFVDEPFAQVSSGTSDSSISIDASFVDLYSHIAAFTADRTLQISNLTSGQEVKLYLRNTDASARTITIQASTTAASHANVNLAPGDGSASVSTVTLAATSGTSVIWVANINNNIVGGILA